MDANELRALADALERMAQLERYGSPGALALESTIAYLRACADAEPVAWIVEHGLARQLTFLDEAPGKVGSGVSIPLYPHPAPAAPQAESADRCRSSETLDPKATGPVSPERPASNREDAAATVAAGSGEQAEPKRKPLTALRILEIEADANRKWRDNGRIVEYAVVLARMVERAHGIGGSDAE